jgi:hypothetical protein
MSAPDPQLRSLYARLEEVLGPEHAETLMTHLPPSHEFVTKADLHGLEGRFDGLEGRFDRMEDRFDRLYERIDDRLEGMHTLMHTQFRNYSVVAASFMTGLTAVFGVMLAAFG